MKTRIALMLGLIGSAATIAAAQPQTQGSITWNLEYYEVTPTGPAGTPWQTVNVAPTSGGTIDAGNGVLFRLSFNMSLNPGGFDPINGVLLGSPLTWDPSLLAGSSGTGALGGLWAGNIDITASGGDTNGTWSQNSAAYAAAVRHRVLAPYNAGSLAGTTMANGNVTNIQPAQFGADANALDHTKSATAWTGMWIPDSYAARSVTFTPGLGSLGFLSQVYALDSNYEFGFTLPIALNVETNFGGGVTVPIVPAPSSLALLGLGGLVAARRRR